VRHWNRLAALALPPLAEAFVRALAGTMRIVVVGATHVAPYWSTSRPLVYAVWHGQILMIPLLNERLRRSHGARPVHVMASRSRDGELLSRFVRRFGLGVVHRSTSRGGAGALRRLARLGLDGHDVAVTPDGPRGPREQAQAGVIALAELARAPLVPVAFAAWPSWRLASWDGFEIPRPFARGAVVFGEPVPVEGRGREVARKDLEAALARVSEAARRSAAP